MRIYSLLTPLGACAVLLLQACSGADPTPEQKRAAEVSAAMAAREKAEMDAALGTCRTTTLETYRAHMAARRHTDAASALRLCANRLPDPELKELFANAEAEAYVDDIKDPKTSVFDKVRAIENLERHYPERGQQYAALGVELRMKLHDEGQNNAEAVRAAAKPSVGMSADDVARSSWGRPTSVNRTTTAFGTSEQWIYGNGRYVYVQGDRVTAIQD